MKFSELDARMRQGECFHSVDENLPMKADYAALIRRLVAEGS